MTVVVSDTSPLSYLIEIDCEDLLPALYGRVLIPRAVFEELSNPALILGRLPVCGHG
jgi:predicted nucleic acid-binding protein